MTFKLPRSIRMLSLYGADALRPALHKGRYIAPLISKRIAANLRKRSIVEGTFGSFIPNEGGWDPSWDIPKKMNMLKPYKGHMRERTRDDRAKKITAALASMPDKIAKYEQEVKSRKPKKDILFMFKRAQTLGRKAKK